MFLLYIAQSRQSDGLFLQTSELGLPRPPTTGECVPSSFCSGGRAHSPAGEGVTLRSWCDRGNWPYGVKKISIKWLWPVKVTIKVIKRRLQVFWWSCDGVPLKLNNKKIPSLQFVITDQMSPLSPLNSNGRSIPNGCLPSSLVVFLVSVWHVWPIPRTSTKVVFFTISCFMFESLPIQYIRHIHSCNFICASNPSFLMY